MKKNIKNIFVDFEIVLYLNDFFRDFQYFDVLERGDTALQIRFYIYLMKYAAKVSEKNPHFFSSTFRDFFMIRSSRISYIH